MNRPVKSSMLFLAIFFVFGVAITSIGIGKELLPSNSNKDGEKNSNFQEFKAPLVKCIDTTMLCGLDPDSELIGDDPIWISQQSRVRITNFGELILRLNGAVPKKTYDVYMVYTPGKANVCEEPEPSPEPSPEPTPCEENCEEPTPEPTPCEVNCPPEEEEPPLPPSIVYDNGTEDGLSYVLLGSFTTNKKGRGNFETNISEFGPADSVHVLVTDHDEDTEKLGDVPRQYITGFVVK